MQRLQTEKMGGNKDNSSVAEVQTQQPDKNKDPLDNSQIGEKEKKRQREMNFQSTQTSRMRNAISQFMSHNMLLAKEINKNKKKMHYKAADTVKNKI